MPDGLQWRESWRRERLWIRMALLVALAAGGREVHLNAT